MICERRFLRARNSQIALALLPRVCFMDRLCDLTRRYEEMLAAVYRSLLEGSDLEDTSKSGNVATTGLQRDREIANAGTSANEDLAYNVVV